MILNKRLPAAKEYIGRNRYVFRLGINKQFVINNTQFWSTFLHTTSKFPISNIYLIHDYLYLQRIILATTVTYSLPLLNYKLTNWVEFSHPEIIRRTLAFTTGPEYQLVGSPINFDNIHNFNFTFQDNPGQQFGMLLQRYMNRPKWELPKKNLKKVITLGRQKYLMRSTTTKQLPKTRVRKLNYILNAIRTFLSNLSSRRIVHRPIKKQSRFKGRPYKLRGKRNRARFLDTLPTPNKLHRYYLRKQAIVIRSLTGWRWRQKLVKSKKRRTKQLRFKKKKVRKFWRLTKVKQITTTKNQPLHANYMGWKSKALTNSWKKRLSYSGRRINRRIRKRTLRRLLRDQRLLGRRPRRARVRYLLQYKRPAVYRLNNRPFQQQKPRGLIRRVYKLRRKFNYHRKAYYGFGQGLRKEILNQLASEHIPYLGSTPIDWLPSPLRIRTLYTLVLKLLNRNLHTPKVYLKTMLPNLPTQRVQPYLFLNKVRGTQKIFNRPIGSIPLHVLNLGRHVGLDAKCYHKLKKPYRFPRRTRPKSYNYTLRKIKKSLRLPPRFSSLNAPKVIFTRLRRILSSKSYNFHPFIKQKSNINSTYLNSTLSKLKPGKRLLITQSKSHKRYVRTRLKLQTTQPKTTCMGLSRRILTTKKRYLLVDLLTTFTRKFTLTQPPQNSTFKRPYLKLNTVRYNSYVLKNVGMFVVYQGVLAKNATTALRKLRIKIIARHYSFGFKSADKRRVLSQRRKQVLARIVNRSVKITPSNPWISYTSAAHNLVRKTMLNTTANLSINSLFTSLTTHNFMSPKPTNLINGSEIFPQILNLDLYRSGGFGNSYHYVNRDPQIRRIRFKPGYQRIWRIARAALLELFGLRFQYQKRLTKYIIGYAGYVGPYRINSVDANLGRTLIFSRLAQNIVTAKTLINQSFVFINSAIAYDAEVLVAPNDFIQLIISLRYYLTFRWFTNWTILRLGRIRRLVYRKNKPKKYKASNLRKQISRYTPNWVYKMRYDDFDTKPYLEVDYLTLSVFVLTEPHLLMYYRSFDLPDLPIHTNTYRMYNWKYIN